MERTAIEKIVDLAQPNIIDMHGYSYTDKLLSIVKEPQVQTLKFGTLESLTKVLIEEIDNFNAKVIVNVVEHDIVRVLSGICSSDRTREIPYTAEAETPNINLNEYIPVEKMLIQLKSKFVETPELLDLVQLLGTIDEENAIKLTDDGFSQSVTVKKGIMLKDNKVINPRIMLTPYRTFADVVQPRSEFLLRLADGGRVALFEADGEAWKLDARKNIAKVLSEKLEYLVTNNRVIITE